MIIMMIFPLSVVLLGTLDYTHAAESEPRNQIADTCSRKLGDYISERCSNLKTKLLNVFRLLIHMSRQKSSRSKCNF
uniref:Putative secreted protein n=1 Tax=Ixodes ricinus TaxID=34613 RepID=V5HCQ9_IXORI